MGRVRKKPKNIESVPSPFFNCSIKKCKSKTNKPTKHVQINNELNENCNSSNEVTQTEVNSLPLNDKPENMNTVDSKVVMPNNTSTEIIDITNTSMYDNLYKNSQTTSSTAKNSNFENVEIVDLTDTTIISNNVNEHINSQASSNPYNIMCGNGDDDNDSDDDVQIVDYTTNNPIIEIIISDDDENIIDLKSTNKSIKERIGISNHSKSIMKKKYNSPLRSFKKQLEGETKLSDNCLPISLGAFVIDKQKISNHTKNFNSDQFKNFEKVPSLPKLQIPSTDTTPNVVRQLRPIAIDGLNIGHA